MKPTLPLSPHYSTRFFPTVICLLSLLVFLSGVTYGAEANPPTKTNSATTTAAQKGKVPSKKPGDKKVDKKEVRDLFQSGEFEPLIALLESMRQQRDLRNRDDSIFIYKYLGVVYGADTTTRRKAESFLYQMLKLDPKQNLEDLEVGDNITALFKQVRKRFSKIEGEHNSEAEDERIRKGLAMNGYPIDTAGRSLMDPAAGSNQKNQSLNETQATNGQNQNGKSASASKNSGLDRKTWYYIAGGAAIATGAIVAVVLMSPPEAETKTIVTEVTP